MEDPYLFPRVARQARPVCGNPVCGKLLSVMNKQSLCYCCQDRVLMDRRWVATKKRPFPGRGLPLSGA